MEHKLKADSAARSAAAEAYGQLRQLGEFRGLSGKGGTSGVETRVQLVEMPATGRRGKVVRVHCRSTSGPVNSYLTYHLLKTPFLDSETSDEKVMFLPRVEREACAIFANGVLSKLGSELPLGMVAYGGPAFVATTAETQSKIAFRDKIPIFPESDGPLRVIDPALTMAPTPTDETTLSRLDRKNGSFSWTPIPPPDGLGAAPPEISDQPLVFQTEATGSWNSMAIAGRGDELTTYSWYDSEPDTSTVAEAMGLSRGSNVSAAGAREGEANSPVSSWYITRGAIAASGKDLYTHAWQYLYRPHRGGVPDNINELSGSRLIRWPCLLRYNEEGWSKVWTPLDDSGNVETPVVPDPSHLWVTSEGKIYGLTSERRLLIFRKGRVEIQEGVVPPGTLTLYRDILFLKAPKSSKLVDILENTEIGLENLPTGIPGVQGEMFDFPQGQSMAIDAAGVLDTSAAGALDIPPRKSFTVFPNYLLSYAMEGTPVADKENLFIALRIDVEGIDAVGDIWDRKIVQDHTPLSGVALASYSEESWQVQPAGLRYFLLRDLLDPPSQQEPPPGDPPVGEDVFLPPGFNGAIVATYEGLPKSAPRYTLISIDTRPFEFQKGTGGR